MCEILKETWYNLYYFVKKTKRWEIRYNKSDKIAKYKSFQLVKQLKLVQLCFITEDRTLGPDFWCKTYCLQAE